MKKYTREEAIWEMAGNIRVEWNGHGSWVVKAWLNGSCRDEDTEYCLFTHAEEDETGLFDGARYNPLCGFGSPEELAEAARDEGTTVAEMQEWCWRDTANGDNYEPRAARNLRLAKRLYELHHGDAGEVVVGPEEEGGEA